MAASIISIWYCIGCAGINSVIYNMDTDGSRDRSSNWIGEQICILGMEWLAFGTDQIV
ncbi:MAG: hypothetical protein HOM27_03945, partial [Candidatus Marinimicrobia bacterium]|nr:hypothetical protein [Candidatus Neomarinimicrobiota bacterium]